MQPTALKMQRKTLSDIVWPGGQKFLTVAEKIYPRIKIFKRTIFLDRTLSINRNFPIQKFTITTTEYLA